MLVLLTRRDLLHGAAIAMVSTAAPAARASSITPERFGARGDGVTNNSAAFAAMAEFVNMRGGGKISLRPVTYIVGRQTTGSAAASGYAFDGAPIMDFRNCGTPLVIRGNG